MEKSPTNSGVNDRASSAEESGWTIYFEEFMASEKKRAAAAASAHGGFCPSSSVASGNSLISDAASHAARKPLQPAPGLEVSEKYRKLSLKRRKGKGLLDDDPLEDTASSPVNSPKVTDLSNLTSNSHKKDGRGESSTQSEDCGAAGFRDGFDFVERANQCTELKKKGLCLVPLSMLVDYI